MPETVFLTARVSRFGWPSCTIFAPFFGCAGVHRSATEANIRAAYRKADENLVNIGQIFRGHFVGIRQIQNAV